LCNEGPELLGARLPESAKTSASGAGCRETENDVVLEHVQPDIVVDDVCKRKPRAVCRMHARLSCGPRTQNKAIKIYSEEFAMGFYFVDPEIYKKYKDDVLELSHAVQINFQEHLPADKRQPGLSDKQIAERLGLEEKVVREIRCVAERDKYSLDEFEEAIRFKEKACRDYSVKGMSAVMEKYVRKSKK
jgi:hypothetical protein